MKDNEIIELLKKDFSKQETPPDEWRKIHYKIKAKERLGFNQSLWKWSFGFCLSFFLIASIYTTFISNNLNSPKEEALAEYLFETNFLEEDILYTWVE